MKRQSKIIFGVLSLSACFVITSAAFAGVAGFTVEEARQVAERYLPSGSTFVYGENNYLDYELKFYNQSASETYEIDVNKQTREITKVESEKNDHTGSTEVLLTENDIKDLVEKQVGQNTVLSIFIDVDDGLKKYNVLFIKGNYVGKFEIHPESGVILDRTMKQVKTSAQKSNAITAAQVKELAEKNVPGGIITDIDVDRYNAENVLKLDIQKDKFEYELKFNTESGELLSSRKEHNIDRAFMFQNLETQVSTMNKTKNKTDKNIFSVEKAKEIALQLAPGSVITDLELDYEHGMAVYEGEMRKGFMEYEFEIDAITGDVLKFSSEYDD
ncbi:MAG: PepSY domain-containing protein [Clostridiales bacterium]|nr:PepSY domain-containing protein [Clostridiales bacterium]